MRLVQDLNLSESNLRKYGITMSLFLGIVCVVIFLKDRQLNLILLSISFVFLLFSFLLPLWLKIVYIPIMYLAEIIRWIISRVILSLIFLLMLVPISIILKIMNKDLLDRRLDGSVTYWRKINLESSDYERQF